MEGVKSKYLYNCPECNRQFVVGYINREGSVTSELNEFDKICESCNCKFHVNCIPFVASALDKAFGRNCRGYSDVIVTIGDIQ